MEVSVRKMTRESSITTRLWTTRELSGVVARGVVRQEEDAVSWDRHGRGERGMVKQGEGVVTKVINHKNCLFKLLAYQTPRRTQLEQLHDEKSPIQS